MEINYDTIAKQYEDSRCIDRKVYAVLQCLLEIKNGDSILEFGCGTGDYLSALTNDYQIHPFGLEKSLEMAKIARQKNSEMEVFIGDHTHIPFAIKNIDKIFCIDVIHQIEEIDLLFKNLYYCTKANGKLIICTESPSQLQQKYWNNYFPSILKKDLDRFYKLSTIKDAAEQLGWESIKTLTIEEELVGCITDTMVRRFNQRTLSVLQMITDEEFVKGLQMINQHYKEKKRLMQREGYTFLVFARR